MKLKSLFLLLAGLVLVSGIQAKVTPPPAKKIMKVACRKAAAENKNVCIIFHASWCGWCHRMDSIMNMPECKPLFDANWVTDHMVVQEHKPELKKLENPGGQEFMDKYNGQNQGIPFWLVFNPKGELLADSRMPAKDKTGKDILTNTGCPAQPDEVAYFVTVLKKTTKLTQPEIDLIADRFLLKKK
ncbi:MAG: thioredoxin family protein [Bacteroidota bacterium]